MHPTKQQIIEQYISANGLEEIDPEIVKGFVANYLQEVPFGSGDYINAAIRKYLIGKGGSYTENRKISRDYVNKFGEENKGLSTLANLLAIGTQVALLKKASPTTISALGNTVGKTRIGADVLKALSSANRGNNLILPSAVAGAGYGALSGVGEGLSKTEKIEDLLPNVVGEVGRQTLTGGLTGGAFGAGVEGVKKILLNKKVQGTLKKILGDKFGARTFEHLEKNPEIAAEVNSPLFENNLGEYYKSIPLTVETVAGKIKNTGRKLLDEVPADTSFDLLPFIRKIKKYEDDIAGKKLNEKVVKDISPIINDAKSMLSDIKYVTKENITRLTDKADAAYKNGDALSKSILGKMRSDLQNIRDTVKIVPNRIAKKMQELRLKELLSDKKLGIETLESLKDTGKALKKEKYIIEYNKVAPAISGTENWIKGLNKEIRTTNKTKIPDIKLGNENIAEGFERYSKAHQIEDAAKSIVGGDLENFLRMNRVARSVEREAAGKIEQEELLKQLQKRNEDLESLQGLIESEEGGTDILKSIARAELAATQKQNIKKLFNAGIASRLISAFKPYLPVGKAPAIRRVAKGISDKTLPPEFLGRKFLAGKTEALNKFAPALQGLPEINFLTNYAINPYASPGKFLFNQAILQRVVNNILRKKNDK